MRVSMCNVDHRKGGVRIWRFGFNYVDLTPDVLHFLLFFFIFLEVSVMEENSPFDKNVFGADYELDIRKNIETEESEDEEDEVEDDKV